MPFKIRRDYFLSLMQSVDAGGSAEVVDKKKKALSALIEVIYSKRQYDASSTITPQFRAEILKVLNENQDALFPPVADRKLEFANANESTEPLPITKEAMKKIYTYLVRTRANIALSSEVQSLNPKDLGGVEAKLEADKKNDELYKKLEADQQEFEKLSGALELNEKSLAVRKNQIGNLTSDELRLIQAWERTVIAYEVDDPDPAEREREKVLLAQRLASQPEATQRAVKKNTAMKELKQQEGKLQEGKAELQLKKQTIAELETKVADKFTKNIECVQKIKAANQEVIDKKKELQALVDDPNATSDQIKAKTAQYEASIAKLDKFVKEYNALSTTTESVLTPKPALTRAVSTHSTQKATLVVEVGTSPNSGFKREIVTDRKRIGEIIKETNSGASAIGNASSGHYLHAALLPDEIQVSSQQFKAGKNNQPAAVVIRQDNTKEVVVNASGDELTLRQKQLAAIEAAKMYAINYNGTDIPEIRGTDPEMSSMMHAALLKFLPEMAKNKIKNYTPDSKTPEYGTFSRDASKNDAFIEEQLSGVDQNVKEALQVVQNRHKQKEIESKGKVIISEGQNATEEDQKTTQLRP